MVTGRVITSPLAPPVIVNFTVLPVILAVTDAEPVVLSEPTA